MDDNADDVESFICRRYVNWLVIYQILTYVNIKGSPKQKYIAQYTVSPYAQSPLKGSLNRAVFSTFSRFKSQVFYWAVPLCIVYGFWAKARDYNAYLYTKAGREELERVNV